jgi:phage head maturation protease
VLQRIMSGHISRCSVGYNPEQQRYIGRTLETTKARLIEISVVDGKRPAWFGTSVSAEVVA